LEALASYWGKIYILLLLILIGDVMRIIQQVFLNKANGQKSVTIPKKAKIEGGDWVEIKKI